MGAVALEANSKHEALGFSGKIQPGNTDVLVCTRPGAPTLGGQVLGGGRGLLSPSVPLPAHGEGVFWGLPVAQCSLLGTGQHCHILRQACCGSDLSSSSGKLWVASGCYPRAPGLHSGELAELVPELGLSGLMSHPDTRQDASSPGDGIPAAFRHSSGAGHGRVGRPELPVVAPCF